MSEYRESIIIYFKQMLHQLKVLLEKEPSLASISDNKSLDNNRMETKEMTQAQISHMR